MFLSASKIQATAGLNQFLGDPSFERVYSLLHFDGADGATTTTDVKSNPVTLSNITLTTAQSRFGTASAVATNTASRATFAGPALGSQDFTVECWVRFTTFANASSFNTIFDARPSADGAYLQLAYSPAGFSGGTGWVMKMNNINRIISGTHNAVLNTWYHVAVSRVAGNTRLFINGQQVGSTYVDSTVYLGSTWNLGGSFSTANGFQLNGHMDEFRLTAGVGRYAANFAPPIAAFPDFGRDSLFNQVYALLHFDGTNGATTTTDVKGNTVSVGTPGCQISTAQFKFGGSAMSFTKVANAKVGLDLPAIGTQDFTIEFWTRFNTVAGAGNADSLFDSRPLGQNGPYPNILYQGTGGWTYFIGGAAVITGGSAVANTWYHVAISRVSGTTRLFINGVQTGSNQAGLTDYNVATTVYMGANMNTGAGNLDGYLDEVRITIGTGRYSAAFTPPTGPFADE